MCLRNRCQFVDVTEDQHIAVHEQTVLVSKQIWRKESGVGEVGRLRRVPKPRKYPAQIRECQRQDVDGARRTGEDGLREHMPCDRLPWVVPDCDVKRLWHV